MCIIAAKPAGIEMPDAETIRAMWGNNHDGAGLMYADKGKVRIEKGFMTFQAFEAALTKLSQRLDLTATPMVLHFRIRTHGGTVPECTHPFPITDSVGALKKLATSADVGVAHNGIIHSVVPRKGLSDTMEYIASQLAPLKRAVPTFYKNKHLQLLIKNAIESKMVFLTKEGSIYTIGDFLEDGGVLYSNGSYKPYNFRTSGWSCYGGGWGVDYDYDCEETVRSLCWLDTGDYVSMDGEMLEGWDFLLDENNGVWCYDYEEDRAEFCPGATAYNASGLPAKYNQDSAEEIFVIEEPT